MILFAVAYRPYVVSSNAHRCSDRPGWNMSIVFFDNINTLIVIESHAAAQTIAFLPVTLQGRV